MTSKLDIVSYIDKGYYGNVKTNLINNSFHIYEIDGENVTSIESFIYISKGVFPQNPPLSGSDNLDAFADSVWGGIDDEGYEKVAIIWKNVNNIMNNNMNDFYKLLECISDLSENLASIEYRNDKPIKLVIFLLV